MSYEHATKRDRCWHAILIHAFKHPNGFLLREVEDEQFDDEDINYATLRRTARGMQELGWLSRRSENAQKWELGLLSDLLLEDRGFRTDVIVGREDEVKQDDQLRDIALLLAELDSLDVLRDKTLERELQGDANERLESLREDISDQV